MSSFLRPTKADLRQVEALANLGCHRDDIASVIGITPSTLAKWEVKSTRVAELLKQKVKPECNIHYPDYAPNIEEAFTCGGRRFYRFKEEYEQPAGRYKYFYAFMREIEMHCSLEKLSQYTEAFEKILNGANPKKGINLGDLWKLVWNLKTIVALDFDPALVKKLASVTYFDETEDLTTYDMEYGKKKIALWEEHNMHDFFLMSPIGDLLGLKHISVESLEDFLKIRTAILEELDSSLQTVSKDNS